MEGKRDGRKERWKEREMEGKRDGRKERWKEERWKEREMEGRETEMNLLRFIDSPGIETLPSFMAVQSILYKWMRISIIWSATAVCSCKCMSACGQISSFTGFCADDFRLLSANRVMNAQEPSGRLSDRQTDTHTHTHTHTHTQQQSFITFLSKWFGWKR